MIKPQLMKLDNHGLSPTTRAEIEQRQDVIRVCLPRAALSQPWIKCEEQGETRCADCELDVIYNKAEMPLLPNMIALCMSCAAKRMEQP